MTAFVKQVAFANSCVRIEAEGSRASFLAEFLFGQMREDSADSAHVTLRLTGADGGLALYRDGSILFETSLDAVAASTLLREAAFHLADRSARGLVLHAGAVAVGGQCLLLPGATGAGKTTLTAYLSLRGFSYLSDELVFVPWGTTVAWPFTRPLQLRDAARAALEPELSMTTAEGGALRGLESDLIGPAVLNDGRVADAVPIRAMLFPRFDQAATGEVRRLSKAEAGISLMQGLLNARNLPDQGFPEAVRLAREVAAYRATYSHFDQIDRSIGRLLASA